MYNTTKQCQEVLGSSGRSFAAFFIPENETTEYREIKSIKISAMSSSDGQITIGDTSSKRIEIMAIAASKLTEGQKIYVYESVKLDDETYQDIPMGKYTITSLMERGGITTIEGAGPLSVEAYTAYFSKLTYPSDTVAMLKEISVITGIQINVENLTPIPFEKKPEGYICREIIGYIAALYGKNAVEERDGSISLKWYEHQETDIFSDRTELPELKKSDFIVNKLRCDVSPEVSYIKGSGTGITISNPFMTEAIMENVWKQIQGYTYRPAEINVKSGNPCIDQWDSYSYGIYNIICACIEHKYDGGVQNTITSHGESETEAGIDFKGPTSIVLERYAAEFVLVNEALVHKLSVDEADIKYLKSTELTTIEADIKNAVIGSLSAEFATVDYLEANYAQLNLANVEKATIGTVLADVGLITEATIVNGHVTGYLDSVNINANSITAGDLSVERLIMRGSENSVIYALNNITGALQAQNVDTINGEVLTKRTVTADRLVAKSITANEIAASTITANNIATNAVTADKLSANAVTTAKLAANAVTTDKLSANAVTADNIATNAVTTAKLAANAVTADKLSVSTLSAITANLGTVTAGTINMSNVNEKSAYITYKDKNGYYNNIGAYGMDLSAERTTTHVSAGYINMQLNDSEAAIAMTRYSTDYATDIAPGWGIFSHRLSVGGYNNTSYALSTASFICNSWVRTVGSTGWYNETYGGGWYMSDTTWIRAHNNKNIYTGGTIQGGTVKTSGGVNLATVNSNLGGMQFSYLSITSPPTTGSYVHIANVPNYGNVFSAVIQRSDNSAWQHVATEVTFYILSGKLYGYVSNSFWCSRPLRVTVANHA